MSKNVSFSISGLNKQIDDVIAASQTPLDLAQIKAAILAVDSKANVSALSINIGTLAQVGYLKARTTYSKS